MQLNNFKTVPQLAPPSSNDEAIPDDGVQLRSAYAAMSDLEQGFSDAGICTDQVWEFIKSEHGVESRSKLTDMGWARIAGELQAARREDILFKILVDRIPDSYFRIHAFSDDPSVPIGRPRDIRKHHIAEEWGDFQQIANENQCVITTRQGKQTKYYEPNRQTAPVAKPVQGFPRVTDIGTNARGEVLSPWGTVVEVHHA